MEMGYILQTQIPIVGSRKFLLVVPYIAGSLLHTIQLFWQDKLFNKINTIGAENAPLLPLEPELDIKFGLLAMKLLNYFTQKREGEKELFRMVTVKKKLKKVT